ncbi:MAG: TIGR00366 family protein [Planctomycetes bacterium]|nr:TIGR00366 family protein [Planctomycetota bacterium]
MLARLSARLADFARRVVPDPFVIALLLTFVAFALGLGVMDSPDAAALARGWFARFSSPSTLAFTTQMALVLVAGATLARAPLVRGWLLRLADVPRTTGSAAALTAVVAMLAAWINWGFGLVAGAVLARRIADRARAAGRPLDDALVAAAGYTGLMVWHGGFSGSAPLKVTEGTPLVGAALGGTGQGPPIPLDETILSPLNLGLSLALLVVVPLLLWRMASTASERVPPAKPEADEGEAREPVTKGGVALTLGVLLLGGGALALEISDAPSLWAGLSLNGVILLVTLLGLLLFGTPARYARAFAASAGEAGGILLQFPFYFGILGVLEAAGLVELLAGSSADLARGLASLGLPLQWSFDAATFLSAGLVNLFVPSGGGQWAVQGTILAQAAHELGLPLSRAVLALSYGDEWTNMLQPFWALALLGITGLRAKDILGYTLLVMLVAAPVYLLAFALL